MSCRLIPTNHNLPVVAALFLAAMFGASCAGAGSQESEGAALLAISSSGLGADVAKVIVTISMGDGSDFTPIAQPLDKAGTEWSGFIGGIPSGLGRQFDVAAYDASDQKILCGSAKSDIAAGAVATVVMVLGALAEPTPYQNSAPVIDYLSASQALVTPAGTVQLGASAHDQDPADTISYLWGATCGTFDVANASAVVWTAPGAEGSCQLSITVADDRGASVAAHLSIDVR